jgi:hypothetical protein
MPVVGENNPNGGERLFNVGWPVVCLYFLFGYDKKKNQIPAIISTSL